MTLTKRTADWLHEVSVLVAVFALLDKILRGELTWGWAVSALAVSMLFFAGAAVVDRYSSEK